MDVCGAHWKIWRAKTFQQDNGSWRSWSYVEMKIWKAKKKKNPLFFFFPFFQSCDLLLLSFLPPPIHSENNVLSPQYLLLSVLIFPCVFCGVSQCWYFSKVCSEHTRKGWSLPGRCSSVITHSSGHNTGKGKKEIIYILWKTIKCVQCFQFLVVCLSGSWCVFYSR